MDCKQKLRFAVNEKLGIEPGGSLAPEYLTYSEIGSWLEESDGIPPRESKRRAKLPDTVNGHRL